jgi:hypothetical protein
MCSAMDDGMPMELGLTRPGRKIADWVAPRSKLFPRFFPRALRPPIRTICKRQRAWTAGDNHFTPRHDILAVRGQLEIASPRTSSPLRQLVTQNGSYGSSPPRGAAPATPHHRRDRITGRTGFQFPPTNLPAIIELPFPAMPLAVFNSPRQTSRVDCDTSRLQVRSSPLPRPEVGGAHQYPSGPFDYTAGITRD